MAGQISIQNEGTVKEHSPLGMVGVATGVLISALVGAIVWGLLASWTGVELTWMALGIGVLAGFSARLLASNEQSVSVQMIAASAALIGIVVGKYYIYAIFLKDAINDALGPQAAAQFSLFSSETFNFLRDDPGSVIGVLDLAWLTIAMFFAWQIPKSLVGHWRRGESA